MRSSHSLCSGSSEHLARYGGAALDPYMLSLDILVERFCFEIGRVGTGVIVAEKRDAVLDSQLELAWLNLKIQGTRHMPAHSIRERVQGLTTRHKRDNVAGLQLADLIVSPNQASDAATTRTHGSFMKWRTSLSRQQVLTEELSLFAAASAQRANKNLDSSEKLFLGGASGIRAYPSSEAGGAEGELLNLELRWRPGGGVTLTAFHDWGRVRVNKDNSLAAAAPNGITLKGHGLAAAWQTPWDVQMKATWARREGSNPNPTAAGLDQDGSLIRDRFWVTTGLVF